MSSDSTGTGLRSADAVETVDVVVLNWNGRAHLETCLQALATQHEPGVAWQVVVVDNGSSDDSVSWLKQRWMDVEGSALKVRLVESGENLGFCGGNNLAIETSTADAIVLLNNDTAPNSEWLLHLVAALRAAPADVAAVSGKLINWAGDRVDFVEGLMTFDGHAFQRGFGKPLDGWNGPESGAELLFACGGNMIIRRQSFLDAGGFDPMYFAYLEDVDLGWRLWSGGERVLFCDEAVARHRSMASSDQLGQDRRGFLFERNAFLTAFKNYDEELFAQLMPAILTTFLARTRTLVADNNLGGELIRRDPYAHTTSEPEPVRPHVASAAVPQPTLWEKWRGWGTLELARRGVNRVRRRVARMVAPPRDPVLAVNDKDSSSRLLGVELEDPRSLAQLQAASFLLDHLDTAAEQRQRVQSRRRRSDREIFAKFPCALVPTYPGDEDLFSGAGFRALLPSDFPLIELTLNDLMNE